MNKLTRSQCRELAEYISNEDLVEIIKNAKTSVSDWTEPSRFNKSFSRGKFWNWFLKKPFDPGAQRTLWKTRILEEFGEYRPDHLMPQSKKTKNQPMNTYHEDPIFD